MKKSLQQFISKLQNDGASSGFVALRNIRGGKLVYNNGACQNGDCSSTNTSNCSNTADCTKATNSGTCSNTGGPGCCGS